MVSGGISQGPGSGKGASRARECGGGGQEAPLGGGGGGGWVLGGGSRVSGSEKPGRNLTAGRAGHEPYLHGLTARCVPAQGGRQGGGIVDDHEVSGAED